MILHIVGEHRATRNFLRKFEINFPKNNIILSIYNKGKVADVEQGEALLKSIGWDKAAKAIDFSKVSLIVVQNLTLSKELFINRFIPFNIPIVWWTFGGDLYNYFLYSKGYKLYAPQTVPFVKLKLPIVTRIKKLLYDDFYRKYVLDNQVCKRIIGIIPCEIPDYEQACLYLKRKVDLININDIQGKLDYPLASGNNILIAHSASLTNNHLYVLDYIKHLNVGNGKLNLPLSYNVQSECYREEVIKQYTDTFGANVNFILDFQDIDTYRKLLLGCKAAIFPSWRQEGLGSIYTCLQLGVKVFFSVKNACYDYFRNEGYYVYAIEDIKSEEDLNEMTLEKKQHNRNLFTIKKAERDHAILENMKYFEKFVQH